MSEANERGTLPSSVSACDPVVARERAERIEDA